MNLFGTIRFEETDGITISFKNYGLYLTIDFLDFDEDKENRTSFDI